MDSRSLLECFHGTLQANQLIRLHSENQLKENSQKPGFFAACLDLIGSQQLIDPNVRKAAAVYFKNKIVRNWSPSNSEASSQPVIDNDERPLIRDNLLLVFIRADYNVKQQLIPVLRVLINNEFPTRWPDLLNATGQLLQTHENNELYTGLLCFLEICRKFRWVDNDSRLSELDPIIVQVFPHLLNLGNSIVLQGEAITETSAEMLKLILKIYKFVTYLDLPVVLQTREAILSWALLLGSVINMPVPSYISSSTASESEKLLLQYAKCNKWALVNIFRLYTRYALTGFGKNFHYLEFNDIYNEEVIPQILQSYLLVIEQWCQQNKWLSHYTLYWLLQILSHGVTQKKAWTLLKPIFENLLHHLVFPLLCPLNDILEIYEIEPHEYINLRFDVYYENGAPDLAALGFLETLVSKRPKTTLSPIITFAYTKLTETVNAPEETLEIAKQKEAALRLIGNVSHYVVSPNSQYYSQMEGFVANLIIPNFKSNFDFVRTRALEVVLKFADLEFKDPAVIGQIFQGVTDNFDSAKSLPVNFICSLVIQAYLGNDQFKEAMGQIILPTILRLLELSEEIDNDAILAVMQDCVEAYSEQLQPFGVDLMSKLVQQFLRLAQEIKESLANFDASNFDSADNDDLSDKTIAAIGILNTMITVLLSFENSGPILHNLEEVIFPIFEYVISNKLEDFFAEIGELVDNITFLLRLISPTMWKVFEFISHLFDEKNAEIYGLAYTEEFLPLIENFLIFGGAQVPDMAIPQFHMIFKSVITGSDAVVGQKELQEAFRLGQTMILTLQQRADINDILTCVLEVDSLTKANREIVRGLSFDIYVQNVISGALVYNLNETINILESRGVLVYFISHWLELIPQLKRVYDLKLTLLGLISLVNSNEQLESLEKRQPGFISHLVRGILQVLKVLPDAINDFEKKRKEFSYMSTNLDLEQQFNQSHWKDDEEEEDDEEGGDLTGNDTTDDANWEDEKYDSFLTKELKNSGFYDDEEEMLLEDPLLSTPLDNLNVFQLFKDFVVGMQTVDEQKYQILFGKLEESERQVIEDVFEVVKD